MSFMLWALAIMYLRKFFTHSTLVRKTKIRPWLGLSLSYRTCSIM